jgi:catechol 2,3-dioxygenase-like lactoylglutathione lyase family enzyme
MSYDSRAGAVLYAKDLDQVAAFYSVVLGLEAAARDDDHVLLESPSFQLVVLRIPDHIASTLQIAVPPVRRANAAVKLVFFVPSIAAVRAGAEARGGVLNAADQEWLFNGWKVCDGLDPEGNVVQFCERAG